MNNFDWNMQAHNAVNEMDRDQPRLSGPTITFMTGAEWQREQLRTPEAIERVALELISQRGYYTGEGWPTNQDLSGGPTGDRDVEFKSAWMANAKDVITALLGED